MGKKLTNEEFLIRLYNENQFYREGKFKVLSKYKGIDNKVYIKDQFGYLKANAYDLLNQKRELRIDAAIFKTEYFKSILMFKNKEYYKRDFRIVGKYEKSAGKILIENKYGFLLAVPQNLLVNKSPSITTAINKTEYFSKVLQEKSERYRNREFELLEYVEDKKANYCILSDKYGLYSCSVSNLCCNIKMTIKAALDKTENAKNRLKEIQGEKYDYSKVKIEGNTDDEKIIIGCKKHGDFKQWYGSHLSGRGCPKCGDDRSREHRIENAIGFSYELWLEASKKSKKFDSYKVYVVQFLSKSSNEKFFKIGRTFTKISDRFYREKSKFDIIILKVVESDDPLFIYDFENILLKLHKNESYKPLENFQGSSECFRRLKINVND